MKAMKKAAVISGGSYCKMPDIKDRFVVCADGGYDNAKKGGIVPDVIIGDMDSVAELPDNISKITASPQKDETDTQLCIDYLAEKGYNDIILLCALGGRPDHELANIFLVLYGARKNINIKIITENAEIFAVCGDCRIDGKTGDTLSLFPLGGDCRGITTKGLMYKLRGEPLICGTPRGMSNVFEEDAAYISVKEGVLAAIHFKGEQH